jgi:hypothetical protein
MFCCAMPNKRQQSSWVYTLMVCAATVVHAVAHAAARKKRSHDRIVQPSGLLCTEETFCCSLSHPSVSSAATVVHGVGRLIGWMIQTI